MIVSLVIGTVALAAPDPPSSPASREMPEQAERGRGVNGTAPGRPTNQRELAAKGYDPSDIQTALNLERQTGIPALTFLEDRKAGKEWPDIVASRTEGMVLRRPGEAVHAGPVLDGYGIDQLVAQGWAYEDVLAAAGLARHYHLDVEELLTSKQPGQTWGEVETELLRQVLPGPQGGARPGVRFGAEATARSTSGLSGEDVSALLDEGYLLPQIQIADAIAAEFNVPVRELLALNRQGISLNQLRAEAEAGRLPKGKGQGQGQGNGQGRQGRGFANAAEAVVQTLGISRAQLQQYRDRGFSEADLMNAHSLAARIESDVDAVLEEYSAAGKDWGQVMERRAKREPKEITALYRHGEDGEAIETDRTESGLTLEAVNELLSAYTWEEIQVADRYAAVWGADVRELLSLRREGLDWGAIATRRAEGASAKPDSSRADELARELGITVEELIARDEHQRQHAEHQRQREPGDRTAEDVANAMGITVAELLRIEREGRDRAVVNPGEHDHSRHDHSGHGHGQGGHGNVPVDQRRPEHQHERAPGDLTAEDVANAMGITVAELLRIEREGRDRGEVNPGEQGHNHGHGHGHGHTSPGAGGQGQGANVRPEHAAKREPGARSLEQAAAEHGMTPEEFLRLADLQPRRTAREVLASMGLELPELPRGMTVEEMLEESLNRLTEHPANHGPIAELKARGVKDDELTAMERMGLTLPDMSQAQRIAEAAGMSVLEVAALKTPDNTWLDVIQQVKPGPVRTSEPPKAPEGGTR